jgi:outer membrane protein OmpA-like peptidoglycan-associated protein|nr:OmpA family protein [Kofleriaceae bacterium]
MRTWLVLVVLAVVAGGDVARAQPKQPLHVGYDADHLDLAKHVLQFKPSRAVVSATLTVIGEDGNEAGRGAATYDKAPDGAWWSISWDPAANAARTMMLKLHVVAADGVATNVELVPWSVSVEHEDVTFRSNSSDIDADEQAKLDASLAKIQGIAKTAAPYLKLQLYIAGHTDTVGTSASNRKLSLDRAAAIGHYFASKQLGMPVVVAGYGEDDLKVKTPDNTDERANRRADYVLGPVGGSPPFKAKASWKPL